MTEWEFDKGNTWVVVPKVVKVEDIDLEEPLYIVLENPSDGI